MFLANLLQPWLLIRAERSIRVGQVPACSVAVLATCGRSLDVRCDTFASSAEH